MTVPALWPAVLVIGVGAFGLLIGSFLNVVIYRVPNGMSIVSPPSACPHCDTRIKSYDNIPVVSWLILGGKCRACKAAISRRYPLVETGVAVFFAVVVIWALVAGPGVGTTFGADAIARVFEIAAYLYLAAVSVALALIDLDTHKLPNAIVLPSYLVGAVVLAVAAVTAGDLGALLRAGIGMAALWAAYFVMALVYPGGMGFGDVKLAGVLGLFLGYLGWGQLAVGAFSAFFLGGLFAVILIISGKAHRKSGIPFGPWMLLGAWAGVFLGGTLWNGYLSLLGVK
jgi:leader peptidase (prepilin peptidase)/N-methyltransferase